MCESSIYTVQTRSNVFGHNPTISSEQKCVNHIFTQFRLGVMCLNTIPQFLAIQNVWISHLHSSDSEERVWTQSNNLQSAKMCEWGTYTVQTRSNVSGHNPRIFSQSKCMNWLFTQFRLRGMCPDTIQQFLGSQNVRIGYLHSVDPE